jgi:hypothetical protein
MRWTKLKQRIEAGLAPSVHDRVKFHLTGYRHAHDGKGRGWITIDGEEVANLCYWRANVDGEYRPESLLTPLGTKLPAQEGVMRPQLFAKSLFDFLSMPIGDAMESNNFLVRALAFLDRRVGKRRLKLISLRSNEHELVRLFYALRVRAEGLLDE